MRRNLSKLDVAGITALHEQILARSRRLLKRGASVRAYALQRHYPNQRSDGIVDARLNFDLRAVVPIAAGGVRYQPQWTGLFAALLSNKRANIQFGYVVDLPHGMSGLDSAAALDLIREGWLSLEPLLRVLRKPSRVPR
jgi:hypothetical protein